MAWYFNKSPTLLERLAAEKQRLETELTQIGPGLMRDRLSGKLRQLHVAANINQWLSSPGLRAPT